MKTPDFGVLPLSNGDEEDSSEPFRSRHAGRDPASRGRGLGTWIPAFAGMTAGAGRLYEIVNCSRQEKRVGRPDPPVVLTILLRTERGIG